MWEIFNNIIVDPVAQLFIAVFSSMLSYDVLKSIRNRPKIEILIYDLKNGNKAMKHRKVHFRRQLPFIHLEEQYILALKGKALVILIRNHGRSAAKSISLYGWIPSNWNFELTGHGDLKGKVYSETEDWIKKVDYYYYKDIGQDQFFRISGHLPPTHVDYIRFNCEPNYELEFILAGENIGHRKFKIEL